MACRAVTLPLARHLEALLGARVSLHLRHSGGLVKQMRLGHVRRGARSRRTWATRQRRPSSRASRLPVQARRRRPARRRSRVPRRPLPRRAAGGASAAAGGPRRRGRLAAAAGSSASAAGSDAPAAAAARRARAGCRGPCGSTRRRGVSDGVAVGVVAVGVLGLAGLARRRERHRHVAAVLRRALLDRAELLDLLGQAQQQALAALRDASSRDRGT